MRKNFIPDSWRKRLIRLSLPGRAIIVLLMMHLGAFQASLAQVVTISGRDIRFRQLMQDVEKQTGYLFIYPDAEMQKARPVTVNMKNAPLDSFLQVIFSKQPFVYSIKGKSIVIELSAPGANNIIADSSWRITGILKNDRGELLSGTTVMVMETRNGVMADMYGHFSIEVKKGQTLAFSIVGHEKKQVKVVSPGPMEILLPIAASSLDNVVVTGLYERRSESYTGSATVFTKKDLTRASASNVFNALRSLDPSFQMPDNLSQGSNPNARQEIIIRGGNSLGDLGGGNNADVFNYTKSPNVLLFILDGFEVPMQRIADLDLNRIKSVTLLKDASATVVYGSRAANGVVVVETLRPEAGQLRVTYTGSVVNEYADLKGYDLLNAREKLELEVDGGVYNSGKAALSPYANEQQRVLYSSRKALVEQGNNTDWKSKPVRNGLGYNNNLYLEGGNNVVTYGITGVYNYMAGAMKGSDRRNISGNTFLSYRYRNLLFRNDFTVNSTRSNNSPYGSFSNYVYLNPYWSPYDANGHYAMYLEDVSHVDGMPISRVLNPMYDLRLNMKDGATAQSFVNNFFAQWQMLSWLRFSGRLAYTKGNNEADKFLPGTHSSFANMPADRFNERGSYTKSYGRTNTIDATLSFDLNKAFGKNIVYASMGSNIREEKQSAETYNLVGFPNDRLDNILQGSYPLNGEKPTGFDAINRLMGYFANISYVHDRRYLLDVSYRLDGSSQFGSDRRFAPFWSIGGGWNMHNEDFLKDNKNVGQLKLRYSYGYTGSSNFASYLGLTTSKYYDNSEYLYQIGTYLMGYGNSSLQWQQTLKRNFGIDFTLFRRLQGSVDIFNEKTKGAVISVTTAPSTGFAMYMDNLGDVVSSGYEARLTYTIFNKPSTRDSWSIFATAMHVKNRIDRISNSLEALNRKNADSMSVSPLPRYAEGRSTTAIWAVPSLGIDPSTGSEIFLTPSGGKTTGYNPLNQVIVGDQRPKLQGTFGTNLEIKGIGVNLFFEYRFGGDAYNQTLASRVENADITLNVDRRVYDQRWRKPGDHTFYKGIIDIDGNTVTGITYNTSRFVQKDNWLSLRNASVYYRLNQRVNKALHLNDTKITLFAGQLFWISSIRQERGFDYPFARSFTLQLNTTLN